MRDKKNGKGIFNFNNEDKYYGELNDDKFYNKGVYVLNDDSAYSGEFWDGIVYRKGIIYGPKAEEYIG